MDHFVHGRAVYVLIYMYVFIYMYISMYMYMCIFICMYHTYNYGEFGDRLKKELRKEIRHLYTYTHNYHTLTQYKQ